MKNAKRWLPGALISILLIIAIPLGWYAYHDSKKGPVDDSPKKDKVLKFKDLQVWQAAKDQCDRVGALLERPALHHDRGLSDQVNRAALSVVLNITEGFLRRRDKETMQFLRYAIASNGELKAAYYVAAARGYLTSAETPAFIPFTLFKRPVVNLRLSQRDVLERCNGILG